MGQTWFLSVFELCFQKEANHVKHKKERSTEFSTHSLSLTNLGPSGCLQHSLSDRWKRMAQSPKRIKLLQSKVIFDKNVTSFGHVTSSSHESIFSVIPGICCKSWIWAWLSLFSCMCLSGVWGKVFFGLEILDQHLLISFGVKLLKLLNASQEIWSLAVPERKTATSLAMIAENLKKKGASKGPKTQRRNIPICPLPLLAHSRILLYLPRHGLQNVLFIKGYIVTT